jgi:Spy/CpxP family protein refolding chaperone
MTGARLLIAGAVVAVSLVTSTAFAQGPRAEGPGRLGGPRGPARGVAGGLALRALGLSEAQQQQIREIRGRYRDEVRTAGVQVRTALSAQRSAVDAIPLNEGAIRATVQELAAAQAEAAIVEAHIHNEVWAVLTPAQQEQATRLRAQRGNRVQQRRQQIGERLRWRQQ